VAALFYRSGWTQEELTKKEGRSHDWVSLQMRFGRFLSFSTTVEKLTLPKNLTEYRFRNYWHQTDKSGSWAAFRWISPWRQSSKSPPLVLRAEAADGLRFLYLVLGACGPAAARESQGVNPHCGLTRGVPAAACRLQEANPTVGFRSLDLACCTRISVSESTLSIGSRRFVWRTRNLGGCDRA
jgi:hypothetical protein